MKKVRGCYAGQVILEFVLFLDKTRGMLLFLKKERKKENLS